MTYYLSKDQEDEVPARMEYLKRVFHTQFVRCPDHGKFICLRAYPFRMDDYCFITGHNNQVYELLSTGVQAETVVLNTCFPVQFLKFAKTYSLYFCHVDQRGFARPRWGVDFKTGFDILDSELLLLHSRKSDILAKIQYAYTALGGKK